MSDLAISPQKYPKIGMQEEKKMPLFSKLCFFYGVLTSFFTCLGALIRPLTKTINLAGIKLEKKMWC